MESPQDIAARIGERVVALPMSDGRDLVAVAGPPASGKSTIARALCDDLNARGMAAGLLAMDGFHLDNAILDARGLRARKGAPETFDLAGFRAILGRLQAEDEVIVPTFDRERDVSVGASAVILPEMRTIVVEGNYLLLDEPGWAGLHDHWTLSVFVSPGMDVLEYRLIERWLKYGFSEEGALEKTRQNDLPNAERVLNARIAPDLLIEA